MRADPSSRAVLQRLMENTSVLMVNEIYRTTSYTARCQVCSKPSNQICDQCKIIHYCNVDHQKEDWKLHKTYCKRLSQCAVMIEDSSLNEVQTGDFANYYYLKRTDSTFIVSFSEERMDTSGLIVEKLQEICQRFRPINSGDNLIDLQKLYVDPRLGVIHAQKPSNELDVSLNIPLNPVSIIYYSFSPVNILN